MEPFILGVTVGVSVGYAVRALISHVRHRRFAENYGYNLRFPPGDWPDRSSTLPSG
jgi:NhaP-type Na+/H+ or K+/H+ antiporter